MEFEIQYFDENQNAWLTIEEHTNTMSATYIYHDMLRIPAYFGKRLRLIQVMHTSTIDR